MLVLGGPALPRLAAYSHVENRLDPLYCYQVGNSVLNSLMYHVPHIAGLSATQLVIALLTIIFTFSQLSEISSEIAFDYVWGFLARVTSMVQTNPSTFFRPRKRAGPHWSTWSAIVNGLWTH